MIDKRFKSINCGLQGQYTKDDGIILTIDEVVELLNELHEENEKLKDVNVQCCNDYSAMRRDVLRYKEENEQLKIELEGLRKKYNGFSDLVDKRLQELNRGLLK